MSQSPSSSSSSSLPSPDADFLDSVSRLPTTLISHGYADGVISSLPKNFDEGFRMGNVRGKQLAEEFGWYKGWGIMMKHIVKMNIKEEGKSNDNNTNNKDKNLNNNNNNENNNNNNISLSIPPLLNSEILSLLSSEPKRKRFLNICEYLSDIDCQRMAMPNISLSNSPTIMEQNNNNNSSPNQNDIVLPPLPSIEMDFDTYCASVRSKFRIGLSILRWNDYMKEDGGLESITGHNNNNNNNNSNINDDSSSATNRNVSMRGVAALVERSF